MKINSVLLKKEPSKYLRKTYDLIYSDPSIWKFSKFDGIHAVIWHFVKDKLDNNTVLDVGCGTGRLSLYLGQEAKQVIGIDFSEKAIQKANILNSYITNSKVKFQVDSIESLSKHNKQKFDLIIFADVLEHVRDPINTLIKANKLLQKNGSVIFSCPGFMNLRGLIYKTFLNAIELPMSLADLRQVDYLQASSWAKTAGFKLTKVIGALYDLAWSDRGTEDLIERLPKALKDKKITVNLSKFNKWIDQEKKLYTDFYQFLVKNYLIKPLYFPKLIMHKPPGLKTSAWKDIDNYLVTGFRKNPYYCHTYPYNLWGGEQIYVFEKK